MTVENLFAFFNLHFFLATGSFFFLTQIRSYFNAKADKEALKKLNEGFDAGFRAAQSVPPQAN